MGRRKHYRHGVFCLEGDWSDDLKQVATVQPVLRLLAESHESHVPHIHRDIGTLEEFKHYLDKWTQARYREYPILYLGFHGEEGAIFVGDQRKASGTVTLDDLEDWLSDMCANRIIYFGSCETMDVNGNRLQRFLRRTGALAAIGFHKPVDWIDSTMFDTLLLGELQDNAMTRSGLGAVRNRIRSSLSGSKFYRDLGFRMVVRN